MDDDFADYKDKAKAKELKDSELEQWKGPMDQQKEKVQAKKEALEAKQGEVDQWQKQWDERDQGADNTALKEDLDGAKA